MEVKAWRQSKPSAALNHGWCSDRTQYLCADATVVTVRLEDASYKLKYHSLPDRPDDNRRPANSGAAGRLLAQRYGVVYRKVDGSGPVALVSAGALFDRPMRALKRCAEGASTITFPPSVRESDEKAFYFVGPLESVVMNGRTERLKEAFNYLTDDIRGSQIGPFEGTRLRRIVLSSALKAIEGSVFRGCSFLRHVRVPEGVGEIGERAFKDCGIELIELPSSVARIEREAFACTNLRSFVAPASLRVLAHGAFRGCKRLRRAELNEGLETLGTQGETGCGVFADSGLEELRLPSTLRRIESGALQYCRARTVSLPEGLWYVGSQCFAGSAIGQVLLPASLEVVREPLEDFCEAFRRVYVAEGCPLAAELRACSGKVATVLVEQVSVEPSDDQRAVVSVALPDGMRSVEACPFYGDCVARVVVPACVEQLGDGAFCGRKALRAVVFAPKSRLQRIGERCFLGSGLEEIETPKRLREIGAEAFRSCGALRRVSLNEGLRAIGARCFEGAGLFRVELPASVREIGEQAFYGCAELRSLAVPKYGGLRRVASRAFGGTRLVRASVAFPRGARVAEDAF